MADTKRVSLAADPHQTFDIVLGSDKHRPPDKRPTFAFHYLTRRQAKEARKLFNALDTMEDGDCALDAIVEILQRYLAEVRGVPMAYEGLDDLLSDTEIVELFVRMLAGDRAGPGATKNTDSESSTNSDTPAAVADPKPSTTTQPE